MSEQAGSSVAVIQERQALLARQHDAVAEADRELADVLASAHAAMRESVRRLDAIAAELDRAVPDQDQLAVDTPMGAREFQRSWSPSSARSERSSPPPTSSIAQKALC